MDYKQLALICLASIILLLIAMAHLPYGYYTLLRFAICGSAAWIAYTAYELNNRKWTWIMGFIAVLFNPFVKVHFDKETWTVIDNMVAVVYFICLFAMKKSLRRER